MLQVIFGENNLLYFNTTIVTRTKRSQFHHYFLSGCPSKIFRNSSTVLRFVTWVQTAWKRTKNVVADNEWKKLCLWVNGKKTSMPAGVTSMVTLLMLRIYLGTCPKTTARIASGWAHTYTVINYDYQGSCVVKVAVKFDTFSLRKRLNFDQL